MSGFSYPPACLSIREPSESANRTTMNLLDQQSRTYKGAQTNDFTAYFPKN